MPVEVKGVVELRKALRQYSPDLAKGLTQEMGAALKPIVKKSRNFLPSNDAVPSNWLPTDKPRKFPVYDRAVAAKGITFKTSPSKPNRRGFRSLATIFNKTAAGAIYETAGRRNPNSVFVRNIQNKYASQMKGKDKAKGRVIYRAWEEDNGKAQDAVMKAISRATDLFNKRSMVR